MQPRRYRLRPKDSIVEAMQLTGTPVETMEVCYWVVRSGYPWLLGNATMPETLVPEGGGKAGDPGIYLDPATGELVIRTEEGDKRAAYGWWVIRVGTGLVYTCDDTTFKLMYELI